MPTSGTRSRGLIVSGALGMPRLGVDSRARTLPLAQTRTLRSDIGARVRFELGELPRPAKRRRLEVVTYLGEVVTYLGEPVTVWVTL